MPVHDSEGQVSNLTHLNAKSMTVWLVENQIAMKRSQGVGSISDKTRRIVIRIDSDGGLSGHGEAAPWAVFSGTTEAGLAVLTSYFWPAIAGQNVADIPKIMKACDRAAVGHSEAKAAVEIALYDLVGKVSGLPIYQLLGGKAQDRIAFSFSLANPDLDRDLELATEMYAQGSRIFKVKTGFVDDHREDVARVSRIRSHLPDDVDLRIDYNQGLSAFGALQKLREMEQFRPTFIEQPVQAHLWDVMADLTNRLDTPILADESVFDERSAFGAAKARIADAFSVKVMKAGGLSKGRAIASIAEQAGIPCYGGTLFEGAIALNAAAHLIIATENISLGCEFYMPKYVMAPNELEAEVTIRDGFVYPPNGPGLGLNIDEGVLERTSIKKLVL